jgi:hypothetical protein
MDRTTQEIIMNYNRVQSQKNMLREMTQLLIGLVGFIFGFAGFISIMILFFSLVQ